MPTPHESDERGYLINAARRDLLQPAFEPLLTASINRLKAIAGADSIALYVRGSIARGTAYIGTSDADMILITERRCDTNAVVAISRELESEFRELVSEVDIQCFSRSEILTSPVVRHPRFYLATQALLLAGNALLLPRYRPGRELANYLYPAPRAELTRLEAVLTDRVPPPEYADRPRSLRFWQVWTARVLVRMAGALAMAMDSTYHSELAHAADHASSQIPELAGLLDEALTINMRPSGQVLALIPTFSRIVWPLWKEHVAPLQNLRSGPACM